MIEKIKNMILKLCEDTDWDWKSHIESVVKYSKILANQLGADEEICEVSAWLHDLIKIRDNQKDQHHVKGAEEAAKILKKFKYPEDKTQKIKHCILTHSSDKAYLPESVEAKIVASADALSHFDNLLSLAYFAFIVKKKSVAEFREYALHRYAKSWNKLCIPEAKELAKPKYDAIKLILGEEN